MGYPSDKAVFSGMEFQSVRIVGETRFHEGGADLFDHGL